MDFTVEFKSEDNRKLIDKIGEAGIDVLDDIRNEDERYYELDASDIYFRNGCSISGNSLNIDLTEKQARESGKFNGKTSIRVDIYPGYGSLTKYQQFEISENYNTYEVPFLVIFKKEKRYLKSITAEYKIDYDTLYDDWKAAGFPLNWKM